MIIYHTVFDVYYFELPEIFKFFAPFIASIFIFVSGISLTISYSKNKTFYHFFKRSMKLLFFALLITFMSFLFLKEGFIFFGILHFFSLSSLLIFPFFKKIRKNIYFLIFGVGAIFFGILISNLSINFYTLLWLGLAPKDFYSFDFFPIFPWFGVMLIGSFFGKNLYKGRKRIKFFIKNKFLKIFLFFGKNSLLIYLIHQPIIILILYLFGHGKILSALKF